MKRRVTRVAAYGLVLQNQHILLCRLSDQVPNAASYWTLPGGGLNFGEDPADAVVREVGEETGLAVKPLGVAGINSFSKEDESGSFHAIRLIYHAELVGGTLTNEIDGSTDLCARWSCEEASQLPLVELTVVGLELAFPKA